MDAAAAQFQFIESAWDTFLIPLFMTLPHANSGLMHWSEPLAFFSVEKCAHAHFAKGCKLVILLEKKPRA